MSIQGKASATKRNTATASKRRVQYRISKRRRDNHAKDASPVGSKRAETTVALKPMVFPEIVWSDDSDESSSSDDYASSSSSSSLDDYVTSKCYSNEKAEWWIHETSNQLQVMSLDHHHLHRSLAFLNLDSLLNPTSDKQHQK
jgi:hypothetical protein